MQRTVADVQLRLVVALAIHRFALLMRWLGREILDNRVAVSTYVLAIVVILTPLAFVGENMMLWIAALAFLCLWWALYGSALAMRDRKRS